MKELSWTTGTRDGAVRWNRGRFSKSRRDGGNSHPSELFELSIESWKVVNRIEIFSTRWSLIES